MLRDVSAVGGDVSEFVEPLDPEIGSRMDWRLEFDQVGVLEYASHNPSPQRGRTYLPSYPALSPNRRLNGVSLVVPAHNEESRISPTIERYLRVLDSTRRPFEFLVVVDGTDRTAEVSLRYGDRGVRVIRSSRKLGKGGAILAGFRKSRFDVVGYVDADGSLSDKDLFRMIEIACAPGSDCVIASRWLPSSEWINVEPLLKRVASRGFNILVRGLLNLRVHDSQCGAKFYRGSLLDTILADVTVTNLTTDVGFLFHAQKNGARIQEVPVTWNNDSRSRFTLGTMIPIMFVTLVGMRVMNLPLGRAVPPRLVRTFARVLGSI